MPGFLERLHTLWAALRLRLRGGAPGLFYIGGSDTMPAPLDRAAEQQAIRALAAGSEEAASLLIEHNLRLVVYIARRFENTGIHIEDLISIGTIGLIKAIHTFKPDKNIKLATYASRCIENEILMYLRKCSAQKTEVSIDEPLNTDWDGNELLLSDILGTDADAVSRPLEDDAERAMLLRAIETLGERDRQIILLRFGIGGAREATQKEVADCWASRRATSAGSKSASSRTCVRKCSSRCSAENMPKRRLRSEPPLWLSFFHAALNALHTAKEQEHHKIDHHDARAGRRLEHIGQHHAEQEIHH